MLKIGQNALEQQFVSLSLTAEELRQMCINPRYVISPGLKAVLEKMRAGIATVNYLVETKLLLLRQSTVLSKLPVHFQRPLTWANNERLIWLAVGLLTATIEQRRELLLAEGVPTLLLGPDIKISLRFDERKLGPLGFVRSHLPHIAEECGPDLMLSIGATFIAPSKPPPPKLTPRDEVYLRPPDRKPDEDDPLTVSWVT